MEITFSKQPVTIPENSNGSLLGKIKSPVIAGFFISTINRATDLGHTLILNSESQLPDSGSEDQVATLITTLGNLIENALEALGPEPGGEISVTLHYRHGWLHCEVNVTDWHCTRQNRSHF